MLSWQEKFSALNKRKKKRRDFWNAYNEYLASDDWQQKRTQALKRDNFQCLICGTGKNLSVHHISYEHLGDEAELNDLITVCKHCHNKIHDKDLKGENNGLKNL